MKKVEEDVASSRASEVSRLEADKDEKAELKPIATPTRAALVNPEVVNRLRAKLEAASSGAASIPEKASASGLATDSPNPTSAPALPAAVAEEASAEPELVINSSTHKKEYMRLDPCLD